MTDYLVPMILLLSSALVLRKRENSYDLLLQGAAEGLKLLLTLVPALILLLCAVSCLIECFGTGTTRLLWLLERNEDTWPGYYRGLTVAFLGLGYLVAAAENGLSALVLYRGAALIRELERDPFGESCVEAANAVSSLCRNALSIICLTGLILNVAQLLLSPLLMNISVAVSFPVMGMAVCFVMLAVTKLLVRGKELKDESDLFI